MIVAQGGNALVDCATYDRDVDEWIVPALKGIGMSLRDVNHLILTHDHLDHSGGKDRILQLNPNVVVVRSVRPLSLGGIVTYDMRGHTNDFIGVLDARSGTLISGDGLQGEGVGKYRTALASEVEYLKTIDKIRKDERVKNLLFSHAYEPWNKDYVFGRAEVERCLDDCVLAVSSVKKIEYGA